MFEKYFICFLALCWGIFELFNGIRSKKSPNEGKNNDKGSLMLLYVSMGIGYLFSFRINFILQFGILFQHSIYPLFAGLFLFFLGLLIRIIAIRTLKNQFSSSVTILKNHEINDAGLYKIIRHPSYLGMLLASAGIGIAMNNWICICFMIIPNLLAVIYRIHIEEKALLEYFGPKYRDYIKNTKCLLPFIY